MHASQHEFVVSIGQAPGLLDDLLRRPGPVPPACGRGRAERAVLITPVLHLDPGSSATREGPQDGIHRSLLEPEGLHDGPDIRPAHDRAHPGEARDRAVIEGRRTSHDDGVDPLPLPFEPAYQSTELCLSHMRHRAGIHHGRVGGGGIVDDRRAPGHQFLSHALRIVLIGLAPEGVEEHPHVRG